MIRQRETDQIQLPGDAIWLSRFGLAYLICILGFSLLSFHSDLLDFTLLPRYVTALLTFLIAALFLSYKSLTNNTGLIWPRMDWPTGFLSCYCIWSLASVFWATNFSEAIFESSKGMLGFAAFYFCRWFQLNDVTFVQRLLKSTVVISGLALSVAIWQIFLMDPSADNAHYSIRGISGHKNIFSTCLFLLAGFLTLAYLRLKNNWARLSVLFFVAIFFVLLFLRTRSVYLGIMSVVAVYFFIKIKQLLRPKMAAFFSNGVVAIILLGVVGFIYIWLTNQLIPLLNASKIDLIWQSDTGYERLTLWEKTACVIRQSPLWGVGAGNWQIEYPDCNVHGLYSVEVDSTTFQRPHNDWLWVWAETGIIGLLFYLGFFLSAMKTGLNRLRKNVSLPNQEATAQIAFIVGFMVIAFFSFPKERIEVLSLIYTLIGLYLPMPQKQSENSLFYVRPLLIILIMTCSLGLYLGMNRMKGETHMKQVLILKQQKKWAEMIDASNKAFSKWYTIDPTSIPIHWYRGTANFVLGNQEAALRDFTEAEKYAPHNQHIKNDLGSCYEKMGQRAQAKAYYKEAIRISPLFDDPRLNLGVSFYNEGKYEEALDWINSISNHDLKVRYREIIETKLSNK